MGRKSMIGGRTYPCHSIIPAVALPSYQANWHAYACAIGNIRSTSLSLSTIGFVFMLEPRLFAIQ